MTSTQATDHGRRTASDQPPAVPAICGADDRAARIQAAFDEGRRIARLALEVER